MQPVVTYSDDCLLFNDLPCSKCVDSQHQNGHLRYVHSPVRVCMFVHVSILCVLNVFMICRENRTKLNQNHVLLYPSSFSSISFSFHFDRVLHHHTHYCQQTFLLQLHYFSHHTPHAPPPPPPPHTIPQPLNDCRSRRGLNDSFAEFDSTEDEEKILRVPKEYVLRVLNSTGALIREECEIECSRGIFTASPGKHCIYPNNVDCIYSD